MQGDKNNESFPKKKIPSLATSFRESFHTVLVIQIKSGKFSINGSWPKRQCYQYKGIRVCLQGKAESQKEISRDKTGKKY